jgi:RNA polymerase sigma-70 factor (ECF subfamily)
VDLSLPQQLTSNEPAITAAFLDRVDEASYAPLFHLFTPYLIAFFRARGCEPYLAEDLAQDVMLTVYLKAGQIRDRSRFRAWLFRIARNRLYRQYEESARELDIADVENAVENVPAAERDAATPGFELMNWIKSLNVCERELIRLRFVEQWEYHEIAAAESIPIGTVLWRVHNAKRKLAPRLVSLREGLQQAA